MAFNKTIWNGATNILVAESNEYIIEGYVFLNDDPINLPFLTRLLFKPNTYTIGELDTFTELTSSSTPDVWHRLTTRFIAKETGNIKIGLYQEYTNEGTNTTGNVDSVSLKGPLDTLTERKTIIYNQTNLYRNFNVKFLDSLGGYSYWTFKTYGDEGVSFEDAKQIKRNIFEDFPNDFIKAQVQNDYVSSASRSTISLRAENLTEQQAKDLFELVRSVRVYDNNDINNPKVLIVDKNTLRITQGEKLYNLTFNATYTFDYITQRQ